MLITFAPGIDQVIVVTKCVNRVSYIAIDIVSLAFTNGIGYFLIEINYIRWFGSFGA